MGAKGVAAAAAVVFFGVTLALYGGWLLYGEVTAAPYTFVAEGVDAEDVDGQNRSVVEFDDLPEDERTAFLEIVEAEGAGEGYDSVSDRSPLDADVVAYEGGYYEGGYYEGGYYEGGYYEGGYYEGGYYEVRLVEVREVGGPVSYVFAAVLGAGVILMVAGVRLLRHSRD